MSREKCDFCRPDAIALSKEQALMELHSLPGWELNEEGHLKLKKRYRFDNFEQALNFTNKIGAFAERIGHHPDVLTSWGRVEVTWFTHKIKGVQQGDFYSALETELIYNNSATA